MSFPTHLTRKKSEDPGDPTPYCGCWLISQPLRSNLMRPFAAAGMVSPPWLGENFNFLHVFGAWKILLAAASLMLLKLLVSLSTTEWSINKLLGRDPNCRNDCIQTHIENVKPDLIMMKKSMRKKQNQKWQLSHRELICQMRMLFQDILMRIHSLSVKNRHTNPACWIRSPVKWKSDCANPLRNISAHARTSVILGGCNVHP